MEKINLETLLGLGDLPKEQQEEVRSNFMRDVYIEISSRIKRELGEKELQQYDELIRSRNTEKVKGFLVENISDYEAVVRDEIYAAIGRFQTQGKLVMA